MAFRLKAKELLLPGGPESMRERDQQKGLDNIVGKQNREMVRQ